MLNTVTEPIYGALKGTVVCDIIYIPKNRGNVSLNLITGLIGSPVPVFYFRRCHPWSVEDGSIVCSRVISVVELIAVPRPEVSEAFKESTARSTNDTNEVRAGTVERRPVRRVVCPEIGHYYVAVFVVDDVSRL